jgi:hypothetical protein
MHQMTLEQRLALQFGVKKSVCLKDAKWIL